MKKSLATLLVIIFLHLPSAVVIASDSVAADSGKLGIKESYVMLYYKSLYAPRNFYGDVLGLEATFYDEWVTLYRITTSSYVGIVKEGEGAYHSVRDNNAVMLSLVVDNVNSWFDKIKLNQDVVILKEIYNNKNAPIRAFLLEDPGGYTVEVFQWMK